MAVADYPIGFIAKATLFKLPIMGTLLRWAGAIPVHAHRLPLMYFCNILRMYTGHKTHPQLTPAALLAQHQTKAPSPPSPPD